MAHHRGFAVWPVSGQPVQTGSHRYNDPDRTRTALQEYAYIRRTKFIDRDGRSLADFTLRSADLEAARQFIPPTAPSWARSPFLRWSRADKAAEHEPGSVCAWLAVANLPTQLTAGQALDGAIALVEDVLAGSGALADMTVHLTPQSLRHAHLLVAARNVSGLRYGELVADRYAMINQTLRTAWGKWHRAGHG